jgi:hypothetical protein
MNVSWLTVENEKGQRSVMWDDVISIAAFKRDLFTVDLICLVMTLKNDAAVQVDEEMNGWDSLVQTLPAYLRGCKKYEEWFQTVAFPAFQTNLTVLYERTA